MLKRAWGRKNVKRKNEERRKGKKTVFYDKANVCASI